MLRLRRSGEATVVEKRPRMTDAERLRKRDRRFFMDRLSGYAVAEIARDEGVSRQYVHARLSAIPAHLQKEWLEDFRDLRERRMERMAAKVERYARSG